MKIINRQKYYEIVGDNNDHSWGDWVLGYVVDESSQIVEIIYGDLVFSSGTDFGSPLDWVMSGLKPGQSFIEFSYSGTMLDKQEAEEALKKVSPYLEREHGQEWTILENLSSEYFELYDLKTYSQMLKDGTLPDE